MTHEELNATNPSTKTQGTPINFENLLQDYKQGFEERTPDEMSMVEFLQIASSNPDLYKSPAQRILEAIGEPELVDTSKDPRLSKIFGNRVIKRYPAFADFYGMEDTVEQMVDFLRHSSQGLEESKQILYLLGPVGGGKSSLAERLKDLMEKTPFYALKGSPIHESPLGLLNTAEGAHLIEAANIPKHSLKHIMSPWAVKRLKEYDGDISQFTIEKLHPSKLDQIAIAKVEPGDDNNQDISALTGKVDIRKLEEYAQEDTDAYSYSGGMGKANRGLLEFVEMFKAPIKVLHPFLTATQERNYTGTEAIGPIPFDAVALAHSNESEWRTFSNNKNNEAFLDRVCVVKVPYCLRTDDEIKIYEKAIHESTLGDAPCAPHTMEILAKFAILTRLQETENSNLVSKMRVYNGEDLKDVDPRAKSYMEYKDLATNEEGMEGFSTREAFKVLSKTFNANAQVEIAADPIRLMKILTDKINNMDIDDNKKERWLNFINEDIEPAYIKQIGKEIQTAYLESYSEYGQNIFDRYVTYADMWIQDQDYRDPETGQVIDLTALNDELEKIEKPVGISNAKDFRNEIVNFVLRHRSNNGGENPKWNASKKFQQIIEKKMFANSEELLPVISTGAKKSSEDQTKHDSYVKRMVDQGYTESQVQLVSEYYTRHSPKRNAPS